jgi:DNA-binding transcriptional LysR family regulator
MDRLTALQVFQAIVDAGSFVGAAQRLGMSSAMVSKQLAALEQHLGCRLIQRTTRRMTLTEAGQDYSRRIGPILAQLEEADALAQQQSVSVHGKLRMSAPLSFGMRFLGSWMAQLHTSHPQLEIELVLSDEQVDLVEAGFDLALRISTQPLPGQLVARPLGEIAMVLCAAPAYLARHGTPRTLAELAGHACLRYSLQQTQQFWQFGSGQTLYQQAVHGPLLANNGDVLVNAAIAGMGIAYQPDFLLADALADGRLQRITLDVSTLAAQVYAVYPARRYLPQKVQLTLALLQTMLTSATMT